MTLALAELDIDILFLSLGSIGVLYENLAT